LRSSTAPPAPLAASLRSLHDALPIWQFSFNSPFGACPTCGGLGTRRRVSEQLVLGDGRISILEGVIIPWGEPTGYLRKVVLPALDRKSTRLNSSHQIISYAVFCLIKE